MLGSSYNGLQMILCYDIFCIHKKTVAIICAIHRHCLNSSISFHLGKRSSAAPSMDQALWGVWRRRSCLSALWNYEPNFVQMLEKVSGTAYWGGKRQSRRPHSFQTANIGPDLEKFISELRGEWNLGPGEFKARWNGFMACSFLSHPSITFYAVRQSLW